MQRVRIRVKGKIEGHWSSWFEHLAIDHIGDETILSGAVVDQASLYGLLARLRDLGLPLVSVESQAEDEPAP
jgi:hypothetical protein